MNKPLQKVSIVAAEALRGNEGAVVSDGSSARSLLASVNPMEMPYKALRSLEEARADSNGALVIEGDWGGTIYLSCPVKYINATQEEIDALAEWLERTVWGCNWWSSAETGIPQEDCPEGGHAAYYESAVPGTGIPGGMGGGVHVDGLWVHEEIKELGDEIIKRLRLA